MKPLFSKTIQASALTSVAALAISMLALVGCSSNSASEGAQNAQTITPVVSFGSCKEVSDPSVDAQMLQANKLSEASFNELNNASNLANATSPSSTQAVQIYSDILKKYPNHCGAQAGLAVASLTNLSQNADMKQFMNSMDSLDGNTASSQNDGYVAYLKSSSENAPKALMRTRMLASQADPMTITRFQDLIAKTALPVADTAIARLTTVMADKNFKMEMQVGSGSDIRTIEFDRGEIGPALASLKLIRAMMINIISIEAEIADENKSYAWLETLGNIQQEDFDNLTPEQKSALDRAVKLSTTKSLVSSVRPQWAAEFKGIPAYLESAIADVQDAFRYGIEESKTGMATQVNDVYKVLEGPEGDVSPKTLDSAIQHLELVKKYLRGAVTVEFNKGKNKLTIDIPKYFSRTTGLQAFLPYHKIYSDYSVWNDIISTDTNWSNYYMSYSIASQVQEQYGLSNFYYSSSNNSWSYYESGYGTMTIPVNPQAPCAFTYNSKLVQVSQCKGNNQKPVFVDYVNNVYKGPLEMTDAAGKTTLTTAMFKDLDSQIDSIGVLALKGKIIFPDPTFGGIFPSLTQNNIWETIEALNTIEARQECKTVNNGYYTYSDCANSPLPSNPSDLDVLTYWFKN